MQAGACTRRRRSPAPAAPAWPFRRRHSRQRKAVRVPGEQAQVDLREQQRQQQATQAEQEKAKGQEAQAKQQAKDQAALQLQRVKEAYDVLSDAKKRAAFIKDFNNVIVPDPTAAMKELWDQYYPAG